MERCNCFLPDYHLVRQRCWLDNVKAGMRQADIHKLWVSTSFRRQTVLFWIIIVDIHLTCRGDFREKGMGIARRHSSLPYNREIPRLLKRNENLLKEKKSKPPLHPATLMLVLFVSISIYAVWNLAGREYSMHWWGEWMYKNLVSTLAKSKLQPFSPSDSHSGWC